MQTLCHAHICFVSRCAHCTSRPRSPAKLCAPLHLVGGRGWGEGLGSQSVSGRPPPRGLEGVLPYFAAQRAVLIDLPGVVRQFETYWTGAAPQGENRGQPRDQLRGLTLCIFFLRAVLPSSFSPSSAIMKIKFSTSPFFSNLHRASLAPLLAV